MTRLCFRLLAMAALTLAAPAPARSGDAAAATRDEAARALVHRYFSAADADAASACFHPDARYEDITFAFAIEGRPAIREMIAGGFAMLRPFERRILREVHDGDQAVIEWEASGVHAGPALGVQATGRRITIRAVSLIRIERGLIRSVTDYMDRVGLEAQLRGTAGR